MKYKKYAKSVNNGVYSRNEALGIKMNEEIRKLKVGDHIAINNKWTNGYLEFPRIETIIKVTEKQIATKFNRYWKDNRKKVGDPFVTFFIPDDKDFKLNTLGLSILKEYKEIYKLNFRVKPIYFKYTDFETLEKLKLIHTKLKEIKELVSEIEKPNKGVDHETD